MSSGVESGSSPTPELVPDSRRSRIDQFNSPSQSPMLKITEEEGMNEKISMADLPPLPNSSSHSRRYSSHFNNSPVLQAPPSFYAFDNDSSNSLYIPGGNVAGNRSSISSLKYMPPPSIPLRNRSPSPKRTRSPSPMKYSPFNFKSTNLSAPPATNSRASHRKGHRYKHSSVSMNLFQEPKPRAPLKVTTAFPIPTRGEFFNSCNSDQTLKLRWALLHLVVAIVTYVIGFNYRIHSFSTLSHLMFYDALSCLAVVFVDIMGNFDVWSKSSITYPFGLGRIEVLFGFALSISLIFVGCDLVSHFIEEFMFSFFDDSTSPHGHSSHNHDSGSQINMFLYEIVILIVAATTLVSSRVIVVSDRPATLESSSGISALKETILKNPTHIITLIFSGYLALNPIITSIKSDIEINKIATLIISLLTIYMGWNVVRYLGFVILLSFPGINNGKRSKLLKIKQNIQDLQIFKSSYKLQNVVLSKVHMNLVIILISVQMMGGSDDDELNLRHEINKILKSIFEGGEIIETTIDIDRL